jgi:hypothetical protein
MHDGKRYSLPEMIRSFACRETEKLFNDESSRRLPQQVMADLFPLARRGCAGRGNCGLLLKL